MTPRKPPATKLIVDLLIAPPRLAQSSSPLRREPVNYDAWFRCHQGCDGRFELTEIILKRGVTRLETINWYEENRHEQSAI